MYSFELPMKVAYAVSWSKSPRSTRNETVAFSGAAGGAGIRGTLILQMMTSVNADRGCDRGVRVVVDGRPGPRQERPHACEHAVSPRAGVAPVPAPAFPCVLQAVSSSSIGLSPSEFDAARGEPAGETGGERRAPQRDSPMDGC